MKTFTGGGIYVEGDAKVTLSRAARHAQVYTIVQGGVTTTVTIDPVAGSAGTTTITTGLGRVPRPSTAFRNSSARRRL